MRKITLKTAAPFVILVAIALVALFVPSFTNFDEGKYNGADVAWIIVATALVFLMTPGLAFFYGGMVNRKNVISTMIKSLIAAGIVSVLWVMVGYSLCFGPDLGGFGVIGNPMTHFMFKGVNSGAPWAGMATVPLTLFALFQLMFAIITPGLVVGAVAERIKFTSYVLFVVLFSLLVYAPLDEEFTSMSPNFGELYKVTPVGQSIGGAELRMNRGFGNAEELLVTAKEELQKMRQEGAGKK